MIRSIQNHVRSIKIMKKGYKITNNGSGFIPEGTKVITKEAFSQCTKLTHIFIPDSVTEIEDLAFEGCTNLLSIILPNSLKKIGWGAFVGCTGLTEIKIPNKVETIDDRAFADCTGLTCITLPDTIEELKSWAFAGCTGLTNIVIPNLVKVINNAFTGCTGLTRIRIPRSVNLIDDTAFQGCTSLSVVEFMGKVEEIGEGIFSECDHLSKILVPAGLADFYKNRLDEEVRDLIEERVDIRTICFEDVELFKQVVKGVLFMGDPLEFSLGPWKPSVIIEAAFCYGHPDVPDDTSLWHVKVAKLYVHDWNTNETVLKKVWTDAPDERDLTIMFPNLIDEVGRDMILYNDDFDLFAKNIK